MNNYKKIFNEGLHMSKLTSTRQSITRGIIQGMIFGISIFLPISIFFKICAFIFLMLIYGVIASSPKFKNKL